ncbi:hypothetical protein [Serinicoccus marinus]|uniref:hypothetical protein n=1 Tax=Serinicoccus marinus TaxID=247333 RepID=UPI00249249B7|nr:hypothetical protein [Serinicoccus marinus]
MTDTAILKGSVGEEIRQGYLWAEAGFAMRVRIVRAQGEDGAFYHSGANLTLKGPRVGLARQEIEMPLEEAEAEALLSSTSRIVIKERHQPIVSEGRAWIVDVFHGLNDGLVVAEYEGSRQAVEQLKPPWWVGQEVTFDPAYANENLAVEQPGGFDHDRR